MNWGKQLSKLLFSDGDEYNPRHGYNYLPQVTNIPPMPKVKPCKPPSNWERKQHFVVRNGLQDKFEISYYRLDFFSEEFQRRLDDVDCEKDSKEFANDLINAISDHLSRRDLDNIIEVCNSKLENW